VGSKKAREEWSAGGVVIRRLDGGVHVLLIRDPYRNWGLPKGHVEESETLAQAALREVEEETGLGSLVLRDPLATIDWYFKQHGTLIHKHCRFFLMESTSGDPVPDESEGITECRWVPLDRAIDKITYENAREVVKTAARLLSET
jgi:8-oxo-dGTP pyrophosphatase MutT (NUDIX family)